MFVLPNNNTIDEDGLAEAIMDRDASHIYFLDTRTGSIGCKVVLTESQKEVDVKTLVKDTKRYILIPTMSQKTYEQEFQIFLQALVEPCDPVLFKTVHVLPIEQGLATLFADKEEYWDVAWDEWIGTRAWEQGRDWLLSLPLEITNQFDGCGECEICRLQEENSDAIFGDFLEAFAKEKRKEEDEE